MVGQESTQIKLLLQITSRGTVKLCYKGLWKLSKILLDV